MRATIADVCIRGSSNIALKDIESNEGQYPIFGASGFIKRIDKYHQENDYVAVVKDGAGIGRTFLLPSKTSVIGTLQYLIPNDKVTAKYLYYLIKSKHLEKYYTGAAIPHIYFKDYKEESFVLVSIEKQNGITDILQNVEKIIESCNRKIELLDELVKARFVEMFENKNYRILKWNDVFNTKTGKLDSNAMVENGEYPFFTCAKEVFRIDKYAFDQEALLLAGNNAAGKYDIKYYKGKFNAYQRTYILDLKDDWSYRLFQYQLEDKLEYLREQSLGGLTKYLTMKILETLEFIVPPVEEQNEFSKFVEQIDKSKFIIQKQIDETQKLFDKLMQDYFG